MRRSKISNLTRFKKIYTSFNFSSQFNIDWFWSEIWIFGSKSGSGQNSNAIFEIRDPKTYLLNSSSQLDVDLLRVPDLNFWDHIEAGWNILYDIEN